MISTMPFGKYRGEAISDLPGDYLNWLTSIDLREPLRSAVLAEATRRHAGDRPARTLARPCPAPDVAYELVGAGLRSLSMRHHPDVGGTHEEMTKVTAVVEWLRAVIGLRRPA